jgi:hypothetical protein
MKRETMSNNNVCFNSLLSHSSTSERHEERERERDSFSSTEKDEERDKERSIYRCVYGYLRLRLAVQRARQVELLAHLVALDPRRRLAAHT